MIDDTGYIKKPWITLQPKNFIVFWIDRVYGRKFSFYQGMKDDFSKRGSLLKRPPPPPPAVRKYHPVP